MQRAFGTPAVARFASKAVFQTGLKPSLRTSNLQVASSIASCDVIQKTFCSLSLSQLNTLGHQDLRTLLDGQQIREFSSRVARQAKKKNKNKIKWTKGMVHPRDLIQTWNIVQGDTVEVIRGDFEGTQAVVKKVLRKRNEVVLEGVNVRQVSMLRRTGEEVTLTKEMGIHYSNVALVDPATKERTRVKYMWREDGSKVRVSKTTGNEIPKPPPYNRIRETNPRDTTPEVVEQSTFEGR